MSIFSVVLLDLGCIFDLDAAILLQEDLKRSFSKELLALHRPTSCKWMQQKDRFL